LGGELHKKLTLFLIKNLNVVVLLSRFKTQTKYGEEIDCKKTLKEKCSSDVNIIISLLISTTNFIQGTIRVSWLQSSLGRRESHIKKKHVVNNVESLIRSWVGTKFSNVDTVTTSTLIVT